MPRQERVFGSQLVQVATNVGPTLVTSFAWDPPSRLVRTTDVQRRLLAGLVVLAAGVTACPASAGADVRAGCRRAVAHGPNGLPAPVTLTTSCGRFAVAGDGRVRVLGARRLPVPPGSDWFMDLTWYRVERGHLLVGRGHRLLWRSRGRFAPAYGVGAITLSRDRLAFSFFAGKAPTLYLAPFGGTEQRITSGETPLGWTRTGALLTVSSRGGVIRVRSGSGRLKQTLARGIYNSVFDGASGALLYLAHGTLERFDGSRFRPLARLGRLGLGRRPSITPLRGVVTIRDSHRLAVLRPDGSLVSTTVLPRPTASADSVPGALAADGTGDVAFTATRGNTAYGSSGSEIVYLLPAGARAAEAVYRERVDFAVCERQAELAWHEGWLLYSSSEGYAAAVDATRPGWSVDLGPLVRRLPGMVAGDDGVFGASWSGADGI